jgi:CheY-like chemotaxis protein
MPNTTSFSLRETCNHLVQELSEDFGNKNIVRLLSDDSIPDLYKGHSSIIKEPLKAISAFMALNLVNGIILLDLKEWHKEENKVRLYVSIAGNGTGESGISAKHKSDDQLIQEFHRLGLENEISFYPSGNKLIAKLRITLTLRERNDSSSAFYGKKVLIIEDNEVNALVFSSFLEGKGISVELAYNGEDGVEMAWTNEYNAIIMDIYMPGLNGIDATRKIREFNEKVPIVALSASDRSYDRDNVLEAGANEYLDKPVSRETLLGSLSKLL